MIPLTAELAMGNLDLSHEQAGERVSAALHEAAHLVASIACPQSAILSVYIHPTGKGWRGVTGRVQSVELYEDEDSFVSLAGYAWEEQHGDIATAGGDYKRGYKPLYPNVLATARAFIADHDAVIRYAAAGILSLCTKKGNLDGRPLTALVRWLKSQIKQFHSQEKKLPDWPKNQHAPNCTSPMQLCPETTPDSLYFP
jgi:hypothetical protein